MGRGNDARREKLLTLLRELGGSAGNTRLLRKLGWDEDDYWEVHKALVDDGVLIRGRGRGGSVAFADPEDERIQPPPGLDERESALYEPCLRTLQQGWAKERGLDDFHIEITAGQGKRRTGGKWTRPDITAVSVRTFQHWPERVFDLWTFEIKPLWAPGITGIFEAAAHSRSATHS